MLSLPRSEVASDDLTMLNFDRGHVVMTGESPNGMVRISAPDYEHRKFVPVDTLRRATFTRKGDTWTFKGESDHLRSEVEVPPDDAIVSVTVSPAPGCSECNK